MKILLQWPSPVLSGDISSVLSLRFPFASWDLSLAHTDLSELHMTKLPLRRMEPIERLGTVGIPISQWQADGSDV